MADWPKLGFGVGLRAEHYREIESSPRRVDWFEAITENYLDTAGRPLATLERIRADYPVALHGVALSIGSAEPVDPVYLERLRALVDSIEPALVTDHLCWTGIGRRKLYDLLPLPYTDQVLHLVVDKVRAVQDALGRRIALENPSTYVAFDCSTIDEWEFLAAVAERADCGVLLDVNNVYVSASNLGFDAERYIDAIPADRVAQIHLAGFTDMGTHLFDTHSTPVSEEVWQLFTRAAARFGPVSTMVEWDADIPPFDRLCAEVARARTLAEESHANRTQSSPTADLDGLGAARARAA